MRDAQHRQTTQDTGSLDDLEVVLVSYRSRHHVEELLDLWGPQVAAVLGRRGCADDWNTPQSAVKVLLNFAQIAIDALVRGGTLDIGAESRDGASEIVVRAAGAKIAFDPEIGKALDCSLRPDGLTSRTAPAWMIHQLASTHGGGVQFALSDEALVMGAVLPEA